MAINKGARAVIDECKKELENLTYYGDDCIEKKHFWEAVIIVYEAYIRYANRYADLAEKMAEETVGTRREELKEMARICRKVPEYPAETFREAIQPSGLPS